MQARSFFKRSRRVSYINRGFFYIARFGYKLWYYRQVLGRSPLVLWRFPRGPPNDSPRFLQVSRRFPTTLGLFLRCVSQRFPKNRSRVPQVPPSFIQGYCKDSQRFPRGSVKVPPRMFRSVSRRIAQGAPRFPQVSLQVTAQIPKGAPRVPNAYPKDSQRFPQGFLGVPRGFCFHDQHHHPHRRHLPRHRHEQCHRTYRRHQGRCFQHHSRQNHCPFHLVNFLIVIAVIIIVHHPHRRHLPRHTQ